MRNSSPLRAPIKRARGLGASHSGTHHFWLQRVSAVALIPLSVWFVVELLTKLIGADRAMVGTWLGNPVAALLMGALIVALFMHARLGVQTIIEDYVQCEGKKIAALLLLNALVLGLGAMALLSIIRLHFFEI